MQGPFLFGGLGFQVLFRDEEFRALVFRKQLRPPSRKNPCTQNADLNFARFPSLDPKNSPNLGP